MQNRISSKARNPQFSHSLNMLTEAYIEALLVDKELAGQVREAWDAGLISNDMAALAWLLLAAPGFGAEID